MYYDVGTMVEENSVRFCVANIEEKSRAASWKVFSPSKKNDVYVAGRELKGAVKISLHESNNWHLSYSPDFYEQKVPDDATTESGRFIYSWTKPGTIGHGVTLALRIVTPWTAIGTDLNYSKKIHYIEQPAEGRAIEVGILIAEPNTKISGWPGKISMNSLLIGSYTLPEKSTVWVVHWEIECPDFSGFSCQARMFNGVKKSDISESVRAMIFGDHSDGSKVLYDMLGNVSRDVA